MKNLQNTKIIAIVGATENVGRQLVELLIQRNHMDPKNLKLFASKKSSGIQLNGGTYFFDLRYSGLRF